MENNLSFNLRENDINVEGKIEFEANEIKIEKENQPTQKTNLIALNPCDMGKIKLLSCSYDDKTTTNFFKKNLEQNDLIYESEFF